MTAKRDSFSSIGREFAPGEVLFREGEPGDVMFVVQSGAVKIAKDVGGQEKVLAILGAGEFLGEMAILNGKPRTATATVVESARCLVIGARMLEQMIAKNSEIAIRLVKKLARRLDSADTLVEILLHRDPKARVLLALSRHAEAFGEPVPPGGPTDHPGGVRVRVSAEDLAREVGAEPQLAREMLGRLRRLGLAEEVDGGVVVFDVAKLGDFVEFLGGPGRPSRPG
jgi:CRP/FNR family cyclic AMP-dependent transcriptional regulator